MTQCYEGLNGVDMELPKMKRVKEEDTWQKQQYQEVLPFTLYPCPYTALINNQLTMEPFQTTFKVSIKLK